MHGADDPLIRVAAGRDTAANIPGARLRIIPGWGHDLPTTLLPTLVAEIADHCAARRAPSLRWLIAGGGQADQGDAPLARGARAVNRAMDRKRGRGHVDVLDAIGPP